MRLYRCTIVVSPVSRPRRTDGELAYRVSMDHTVTSTSRLCGNSRRISLFNSQSAQAILYVSTKICSVYAWVFNCSVPGCGIEDSVLTAWSGAITCFRPLGVLDMDYLRIPAQRHFICIKGHTPARVKLIENITPPMLATRHRFHKARGSASTMISLKRDICVL